MDSRSKQRAKGLPPAEDIDKVSTDFRVVCEDLLYISNLKK